MTNTTDLTIAIVGTGIGGTEMAGYLGVHGHRVRVHDVRAEAVSAIRDRGGLDVTGIATGFAKVERATTDLAEAVDGAHVIAVTTVNNDHAAVATALAPHLRDGQIVCLIPGYVGGALQFRHELDRAGSTARVMLGEMDNFPFTGAITAPGAVRVASLKRRLQVAALPAADASAVVGAIAKFLPPVAPAASVFQTGLAVMNPILHVPGMLANQGRLDAGEAFQFYGTGITESVARVVDTLDRERLAVARAYGATVPSVRQWLADAYGLTGDDLYALIQRLHREVFKDSPAPSRLDARYVTEDVPYGLVPLAELGRAAGVATPIALGLSHVASAALGRDFWQEGRTLARMGLEGRSLDAIQEAVTPTPRR